MSWKFVSRARELLKVTIMARGVILGGAILFLSSCTSPYEPEPKIVSLDAEHLISQTAALASTVVVRRGGSKVFCVQTAPDASFNQGESGTFAFNLFGSQSDSGSVGEQSSEAEFVGRTPAVLLTRELLYRLCEFSYNHDLTKEEAIALYHANLALIEKITMTESSNTTVTIGETLKSTEITTNQDEGKISGLPVSASTPNISTPGGSGAATQSGGTQSYAEKCRSAGYNYNESTGSCTQ